MKSVSIYALRDPDTDSVRYVGETRCAPKSRLLGHMAHATNWEMFVWLSALRSQGRRPAMQVIEEVEPYYNWPAREKFWIEYFLSHGCSLLNTQSGGLYGKALRRYSCWRKPTDGTKRTRKVQKPSCPRFIQRTATAMGWESGKEFVGETLRRMERGHTLECFPPKVRRWFIGHPKAPMVNREA